MQRARARAVEGRAPDIGDEGRRHGSKADCGERRAVLDQSSIADLKQQQSSSAAKRSNES